MTKAGNDHILHQYDDGLITAAEALMQLSTGTSIDNYANAVEHIAASLYKQQLEDQSHYYSVLTRPSGHATYTNNRGKQQRLLLKLTDAEAYSLGLVSGKEFLLFYEMREHIRKIDEDK